MKTLRDRFDTHLDDVGAVIDHILLFILIVCEVFKLPLLSQRKYFRASLSDGWQSAKIFTRRHCANRVIGQEAR
jgi:hypothetical protein